MVQLCELNGAAAEELQTNHTLVISTDEKSGIQALERAAPDLPRSEKHPRKRECNYVRHGTQTLIGGLVVASGQVYAQIGATRTEQDYAAFIRYVVEEDTEPLRRFVFTADQLNTHKSETLVRLVAQLKGDTTTELGIKGKSGVLQSMESRMAYLEQVSDQTSQSSPQPRRVRFLFTPKHCSWLNPIEGWFSGLSRRVIQLGNFTGTEDLADKILAYVDYFNEQLAQLINWSIITKEQIADLVARTKRLVMQLAG